MAAAGFVAITWAMSRHGKSWGTPAFFFLLVWSGYIALPLVFAWHFYVSLGAMVWLLGMGGAWTAGSVLGYGVRLGRYREHGAAILARRFSTHRTAVVIVVGSTVAAGAIAVAMRENSLQRVAGSLIIGIEQLARNNASGRYQGEFAPTTLQNLLLSVGYFSAILAGLFTAANNAQGTRSRKRLVVATLPILVITAFGIVQNTKASALYAIVLWLAGYLLIVSSGRHRLRGLFKPRLIVIGLAIASVLLALFYWMQSTRYSNQSLTAGDFYSALLVYGAGHLGGFSYWIDHYFDPTSISLGSHSFAGLFGPLGLVEKTFAPAQLPKPLWQNLETNVDTAFSELIQDFGLVGALAMTSVFGFVVTLAHRLFTRGNIFLAPVLCAFYMVTLWSFTSNLLNYTSILAALTIFLMYLYLGQARLRR